MIQDSAFQRDGWHGWKRSGSGASEKGGGVHWLLGEDTGETSLLCWRLDTGVRQAGEEQEKKEGRKRSDGG